MGSAAKALARALEQHPITQKISTRLNVSTASCVKLGAGVAVVVVLALAFALLSRTGLGGGTGFALAAPEPQGATAASAPAQAATAPSTPTSFDDAETLQHMAERELARQPCVVYVTGAVAQPGLYTLTAGQRIGDAVAAAGGLTPEAALAAVNLAQIIEDGMQITLPTQEQYAQGQGQGQAVIAPSTAGGGEGAAGGGSGGSSSGSSGGTLGGAGGGLVNINTADSSTLQTLTGVGPATAQKIIEYRTAHGRFASKEELMQVSGIGAKKYATLEPWITV